MLIAYCVLLFTWSLAGNALLQESSVSCPICTHEGCHRTSICVGPGSACVISIHGRHHDEIESWCGHTHECDHGHEHTCCTTQACVQMKMNLNAGAGSSLIKQPTVSCPICTHEGCHRNSICEGADSACVISIHGRHHDEIESWCGHTHECEHGHEHTCCTTQTCVQHMLNLTVLNPGPALPTTHHMSCPNCHLNGCFGNRTCTDVEPFCLLTVHHERVENAQCVAEHDCHGRDHTCCKTHACVEALVHTHQDNALSCPVCSLYPFVCEPVRRFCHHDEACVVYTKHNIRKSECKMQEECIHHHIGEHILRCCVTQNCIDTQIYNLISTTSAATSTAAAATTKAATATTKATVKLTTVTTGSTSKPTAGNTTVTTTAVPIQNNVTCSECSDYVGFACNSTSTICPDNCMIRNVNGQISTSCNELKKCRDLQMSALFDHSNEIITCCTDNHCYTNAIKNALSTVVTGQTGNTVDTQLTCPPCLDALTSQCTEDEVCHNDEVCMVQISNGKVKTGCTRSITCSQEGLDTTKSTTCCTDHSCLTNTIQNYIHGSTGTAVSTKLTCPQCMDAVGQVCTVDMTCHTDEVCMVQHVSNKIKTGCIRDSMCALELTDSSKNTFCCKTTQCLHDNLDIYITKPTTTTMQPTTTQDPDIITFLTPTVCEDNDDPKLPCSTMVNIWGICSAVSGTSYYLANTRCRKSCQLCKSDSTPTQVTTEILTSELSTTTKTNVPIVDGAASTVSTQLHQQNVTTSIDTPTSTTRSESITTTGSSVLVG